MGGMTFCMEYIIRGGGVLINGNGYAKFPKNGVYPLQLGTWEYIETNENVKWK